MLTFGTLLDLVGVVRKDVRLLRHQDTRYPGHPAPFALWRDDRERFERYQETQGIGDAPDLRAGLGLFRRDAGKGDPIRRALFGRADGIA